MEARAVRDGSTVLRRSAFLVAALLGTSQAAGQGGGIVYGRDHAFLIKAPAGWVLDNQSGQPNGLHAVFYPQGSPWNESVVVMYANGIHKNDAAPETVQQFVAGDVANFRKKSPGMQVTDGGAIPLADNKRALVRHFSGVTAESYEAVAYIDEPKVVVVIVMSARSRQAFDASLQAFQDLVRSYKLFTQQVEIR